MILILSACGDPGVKVAEEKSSDSGANANVVTAEANSTTQENDANVDETTDDASDATAGTASDSASEPTPATNNPSNNDAGSNEADSEGSGTDEAGSEATGTDEAGNGEVAVGETGYPTIATLVGFFITSSDSGVTNYAGITADGKLTDYTYDTARSCYVPTVAQITDRGMGVFWVNDGEVTTELRLAVQNGNLILFVEDINEPGRIVYPGTTEVSRADLTLC